MNSSGTNDQLKPKHPIQFFVPEETWLEMKQVMPHRGEISSMMASVFHKISAIIKEENIQYVPGKNRNLHHISQRLTISPTLREGHLDDA